MVSKPNSEYADVTDMFRRLTTLDQESIEYRRQRDVIVERCLPLADHIARRFSNRGEPFEDLVQVARVGLINAVNRFDADKGAQFLAFAVPTILGEVRRYFRDHSWSVKVPRGLKELSSQLKRAREELSQQIGSCAYGHRDRQPFGYRPRRGGAGAGCFQRVLHLVIRCPRVR